MFTKGEKYLPHGYYKMGFGILVFLVGLMRYYGWEWSIVLMVVGVLIFLCGLYVTYCKK